MITPSAPSQGNTLLGDGIIYKNYALATQREIGACSGDSKFIRNGNFNHVDYNGMYGPTKGQKYKTKSEPSLSIALLELSPTNLADCFAGLTVTDNTTYYEVTESLTVSDSQYWTNLTFIGETKSGLPVWIQMDNVLGDTEKIELAIKTDNPIIVDCLLTGHYGTAALTTPPWRMRYYKA
jgi:hypothetical protein